MKVLTQQALGGGRRCVAAAFALALTGSTTVLGQEHDHHAGHGDQATVVDPTSPEHEEALRQQRIQERRRGGSRWGAEYFPNIPLITHEGERVHFFDDLIEDKVVAINFIFTTCTDSCPLETARLAAVQQILGDRVGQDVFMYSITIDPEVDTPEVLKEYAEKFGVGPGWSFLTGKEADITLLRRKLGLYINEIQAEDSTDHNLNLIIGNQATGQWIKRSPFEDPYFLAEQIGSWLTNWELPSAANQNSYAEAPKLRNPSLGENLFRTRCLACHSIGGGDVMELALQRVGPDLLGVTEIRDPAWLTRWLAEPDMMLAEQDPIAMELYAKYNNMAMPNLRLNQHEVVSLIEYMAIESRRVAGTTAHSVHHEH